MRSAWSRNAGADSKGGQAVKKNASPTAPFQITRMGCPSAWGSAKADVPPPPYQSPPIPRVRRGFGRDGLITGCADRGGEQQGGDAGRGREREPGHPTELQAERHPSTRLDSRRARRRSAAEKLGPAHQLRPGRNRKPVVGTPSHEAKYRARLDVVRRGHQRRTNGDIQRGGRREPATIADGRPDHESEPVQTREHRCANGVPGGDVGHDAPIGYFAEGSIVGSIPAEHQVGTEIREDERGAGGSGLRPVAERGALGRGWLGPRQQQSNEEQGQLPHRNLPLSGSCYRTSVSRPCNRRKAIQADFKTTEN